MNDSLSQLLRTAYQQYADGKTEQALLNAFALLDAAPQQHECYQIAAMCEARLDHLDAALVLQRQAIEQAPGQAEYHYNMGVLQQQANNTELAMLSYANCLRLEPEHANALWNYGDLLRVNEHFAEAVSCLEKLLLLEHSAYAGIYHRLAVAYGGAGRYKAAARCFEQSLSEREPDTERTQWEYSHLLLAEGRLRAGWRAYESRYLINGPGRIVVHSFPYARWQGESLHGLTLLIHAELGIGDQIMFASIIPQLLAEGAKLIIACHPSLCRLFGRSFEALQILPHTIDCPAQLRQEQKIDYEIPICSLAHWRGPWAVEQMPAQNYLHSIDADSEQRFEQQIRCYCGDKPPRLRVGLMWSANPAKGVDWGERRSLQKSVAVELLSPLAQLRDEVDFISLQNRDAGAQAAHAPSLNMLDLHDQLLDFADTAALINCLDLVVSVDTSVAHLAGAMGKPVVVLLKAKPDWRWLNSGNSSYWYASATLLRQQDKGDWSSVVEQIIAAIQEALVRKSQAQK